MINVSPDRTPSEGEAALAAAFETAHARLPGNALVAGRRAEAFADFAAAGLPNRRVESWHYTDLRSALSKPLPLAALADAGVVAHEGPELERLVPRIAGLAAARLVLVDGAYVEPLSERVALPSGVRFEPLADALARADEKLMEALSAPGLGAKDPAIALNAAFMQGGFVVEVADGAQVDLPIELVSIATEARGQSSFSRSLVRVGKGARLTLIETHAGAGMVASQRNDAFVLDIGEGASVDHVLASPRNAPGSVHVASFLVRLGAGANLRSFAFLTEAAFTRRQSFIRFDGAHAAASLSGLSLLDGHDHADTTLVVEHVAPHCQSRELFKHIVAGSAAGVFQGRIVVAPGAQKTDGGMSSRAILLSEDAAMYNKPELEIFADDVVCGHGATCGELDEDQLFYCLSRGIPRADAEALLLEAFAGEAVETIANETIREAMMERVRARLALRSGR